MDAYTFFYNSDQLLTFLGYSRIDYSHLLPPQTDQLYS